MIKNINRILVKLLLMIVITNCGILESNNSNSIEIKTNSFLYKIDSTTFIELKVKNNSSDPVYYICSGDVFLEELKSSKVINSWKVHGFEECLAANPINDNEEETFNISIQNVIFHVLDKSHSSSLNSNFRLRVDLYKDNNFNELVSLKNRYSNYFELE